MVCKGTHIFLIVAKFLSENAKIAFSWTKNTFSSELSALLMVIV
jgi:hypothetical protein